jgi:hydrogenase maturation protease
VRLQVIGLGSPCGDDAAGLEVVRLLSAEPLPDGVQLVASERPGLDLVEALEEADAAVLVDAVRSGASPGTVWELDPREIAGSRTASSHAFGVAHALALSKVLGRLTRGVRIVAIELESAEGCGLSPAVRAALPQACRQVRQVLAELTRELLGTEAPPHA